MNRFSLNFRCDKNVISGGAYARAIELARNVSPDEVTNLEEEWGDW